MATKITDKGTYWLISQLYSEQKGRVIERAGVRVKKGDREGLRAAVEEAAMRTRIRLHIGGF